MVAWRSSILDKWTVVTSQLEKLGMPRGPQAIRQWIEDNNFIFLLVGSAYVLATLTSSLMMSHMMRVIHGGKSRVGMAAASETSVTLPSFSRMNFRDARKEILDRNLFNSEGKVPDEKFLTENSARLSAFRLDAPCNPSTLNIELLGTIFLGDPSISIATVKEKNIEEADIYRVGDLIIGSENAVVAAVERQRLVLNNNGVKECFDLNKEGDNEQKFSPFGGGVASQGGNATLESSFVESELGPGFGKIIESARLVPNAVDGGINGFKIFAIRPDSLFARVGLQNGYVITQVNDTSLTQPDQGFAVYQAFQDEKKIRILVLRDGSNPVNLNVQIN